MKKLLPFLAAFVLCACGINPVGELPSGGESGSVSDSEGASASPPAGTSSAEPGSVDPGSILDDEEPGDGASNDPPPTQGTADGGSIDAGVPDGGASGEAGSEAGALGTFDMR